MNCEILFNSQKKVWFESKLPYTCVHISHLYCLYFHTSVSQLLFATTLFATTYFCKKGVEGYLKILISRTFDGWFVGISISDGEAVANLTENFLQANKIWFTVLNFSNIKSNFKFPVVFLKLFKSWYFKKVLKLHWFKQWKTLNCLN